MLVLYYRAYKFGEPFTGCESGLAPVCWESFWQRLSFPRRAPRSSGAPNTGLRASRGTNHLYRLEHDKSIAFFTELEKEYPHHPGPPLAQSIAIWFRELVARRRSRPRALHLAGIFHPVGRRGYIRAGQTIFFRRHPAEPGESDALSRATSGRHRGALLPRRMPERSRRFRLHYRKKLSQGAQIRQGILSYPAQDR